MLLLPPLCPSSHFNREGTASTPPDDWGEWKERRRGAEHYRFMLWPRDMRQNFLPVQWLGRLSREGAECPHWRYSRAVWAQFCALYSGLALLEQGGGTSCGSFHPDLSWDSVMIVESWNCLYFPLLPLWRSTPYLLDVALGSSNSCLMSLCTL